MYVLLQDCVCCLIYTQTHVHHPKGSCKVPKLLVGDWALDDDLDKLWNQGFFLRAVFCIYMGKPVRIYMEKSVHLKKYGFIFIFKDVKI